MLGYRVWLDNGDERLDWKVADIAFEDFLLEYAQYLRDRYNDELQELDKGEELCRHDA